MPYRWLHYLAVLGPSLGGFACIVIASVLHFQSVNRTHCQVPNILPSISAAIGNNSPEKYVWRHGIAFMIFQQLLAGLLWYNLFGSQLPATKTHDFLNRCVIASAHAGFVRR